MQAQVEEPDNNTTLIIKPRSTIYERGAKVEVYDNSGQWREAIIARQVAFGVEYRFNTPEDLKYRPDFASFDRVRPAQSNGTGEAMQPQINSKPDITYIEPLRDGERVRIFATLPDGWTGPAAGTAGVIVTEAGKRGFKPDGEAMISSVHVGAKIKRNEKRILDFCERIPAASPVEAAPEQAGYIPPRSPQGFYHGQRVRVTVDIAGHYPLSVGDEGVVVNMRGTWGFQAIGRLGATFVLDKCEAIPDNETPAASTQPAPDGPMVSAASQVAALDAAGKSASVAAAALAAAAEFQPGDPLPEESKVASEKLIASLNAEIQLLQRQLDALTENNGKLAAELEDARKTFLEAVQQQYDHIIQLTEDNGKLIAAVVETGRDNERLNNENDNLRDENNILKTIKTQQQNMLVGAANDGWIIASEVLLNATHRGDTIPLRIVLYQRPADTPTADAAADIAIDAANAELKDTMKAAFVSAGEFKPLPGSEGV